MSGRFPQAPGPSGRMSQTVVRHSVARSFARCGVVRYDGGTCAIMVNGGGIDLIVELSRAQAALLAMETLDWVLGPLVQAYCMECQEPPSTADNQRIDRAMAQVLGYERHPITPAVHPTVAN